MLIAFFPAEDLVGSGVDSPVFTALSDDEGLTWSDSTTLTIAKGVILEATAGIPLAANQALIGDAHFFGDGYYTPGGVGIVDVTESPLTYVNRIDETVADSIEGWSVRGFVDLGSGDVWALGNFPNSATNLLKSNNGGAVFNTTDAITGAFSTYSGDYRDGTLIIGGVADFSGTLKAAVFRSTDRGDNFDTLELPVTSSTTTARDVRVVRAFGSGVWLAGGRWSKSSGSWARLWRSTDDGETWSEVTDDVTSLPTGNVSIRTLVGLQDGRVVLGLDATTATPEPFRFSTDAGLTFPSTGTYETSLGSTGRDARSVAPTNDGAMVATVVVDSTIAEEIWRGELNIDATAISFTRMYTTAPTFEEFNPVGQPIVINTNFGEEVAQTPAMMGMMG